MRESEVLCVSAEACSEQVLVSGFEAEVFVPAPRDGADPGPHSTQRCLAQKLYLLVQRGDVWEFPAARLENATLRKAGSYITGAVP